MVIGQSLGPYRVLEKLGEGGMGEVYRARDTKLNRDVALKVLPEAFTVDSDRLARFKREAYVLAALNHSNIGAIYGLEDSNGVQALVLELVDGPTLADRIAEGPLSLDEAVPIAKQIAEALEAAHERGIIHRDLKPANIKLTPDGSVKVLDFGLAKALASDPAGAAPSAQTQSPTITSPVHLRQGYGGQAMTQVGMILGTAAYMSPEQAKGRDADKRSDIWAFGAVLFEMLTGKRAFDPSTHRERQGRPEVGPGARDSVSSRPFDVAQGHPETVEGRAQSRDEAADVAETLAAVLRSEPDWSALPAEVPPSIVILLRRCLEKDRRRRIAEVAAALFVLTEYDRFASSPATSGERAPARAERWSILAVAAVALAAIAGLTAWALIGNGAPAAPQPTRRFTITLPEGALLPPGWGTLLAISRDGRTLVYQARSGTAPTIAYRRSINQFEVVAIPGTEDSRSVGLSPDGLSLIFFADGTLKKTTLAGGPAQTVTTIRGGFVTSHPEWNTANQVIFSLNVAGGALMEVPAAGGEAAPLFKPEARFQARYPQSIPRANAVLFTLGENAPDSSELHVMKRDTGEHRTVLRSAAAGRVLPTGHLLFVRAGALWAVAFDVERLEAVGTPIPVVEGVRVEPGGAVQYDVSDEGSLVFIPASAANEERSLVFVGPDGRGEPLNFPEREYTSLQLSPDRSSVAVQIGEGDDADVWVGEVGRGALTRVTRETGFDGAPIWSPDGKTVVFASSRADRWTLHRMAADGTGQAAVLATFDTVNRVVPGSWSADGKVVVVEVDDDIGVVDTGGQSEWKPLIRTPARESQPVVSPDGRWIAYVERENGVYLQRFPGLGEKRPVSLDDAGYMPVWSGDGRALFYLRRTPTNALMRVSVKAGPDGRLDIAAPEVFTEFSFGYSARPYDLSSDGRRALVISQRDNVGTLALRQINVVVNWFDELKRLVPVK